MGTSRAVIADLHTSFKMPSGTLQALQMDLMSKWNKPSHAGSFVHPLSEWLV
jgi:hypothetical protein